MNNIYFRTPPQLELHDILYVQSHWLTVRRRSHQIHGSKHTPTIPCLSPWIPSINSCQLSIPVHRPNECSRHVLPNRRPRIKINWSTSILPSRPATYKSRIANLGEGSCGKKLTEAGRVVVSRFTPPHEHAEAERAATSPLQGAVT